MKMPGHVLACFAVVCALSPAALAQRPRPGRPAPSRSSASRAAVTIVSQSEIHLDGGGFHNETFALPRARGDWFSLPSDAHASLDLESAQGAAAPVKLALQWDGKAAEQIVTHDTNSDLGGAHVSFFLTMSGTGPYDLAAKPDGDDVVKISVAALDDHDVDARVSGTLTRGRNDAIRISGMIRVHRDTLPVRVTTAAYRQCDPVVYDKFYGAEGRSPSECEVKFDSDVRRASGAALKNVIDLFKARQWVVDQQSKPGPIVLTDRGVERAPYRLAYEVVLKMGGDNADARRYRQRLDDITSKMSAGGASPAALQTMMAFGYEMGNATEIGIDVVTNAPGGGFVYFKDDPVPFSVPGAAYAASSGYVQAATGGDVDNSHDQTVVLLGAWGPPSTERHADGGGRLSVPPRFNPAASKLSAQNVLIRIRANAKLANDVISHIDFAPLQQLLAAPQP